MEIKSRNYLSIDAGHGALSALHTIEEILGRLQFDLGLDEEIRARDHFDLITGTDIGAIIALLLGRLGLTPSQAIGAYLKLEPFLLVASIADDEERKRLTEGFDSVFSEILSDAGIAADTPMLETGDSKAKTIICAVSTANLSILHPIRSYRARGAAPFPCTILQAARASVASFDRLSPVPLTSSQRRVALVGAMACYANPTRELLLEAQRVFGEDTPVATIISLGSGKADPLALSGDDESAFVKALKRTAIDCEQAHGELLGRLHQTGAYFRFNVGKWMGNGVDSTLISAYTSAYMQEADISTRIDEVVESIKNRPSGGTLKDINSVEVVKVALKPRPSLVRNFVGREDILEAMRRTHFGDSTSEAFTPKISVLMGLGGSGKTQTALRFALEYEKKHINGKVYFVNASSEENLKADYELIIRSQGMAYRSKSYSDTLLFLATQLKEWCLILDNVDDPSWDIFPYIPKCAHGNVIITTRNDTYAALSPSSSHRVAELLPSEATSLILKASAYVDSEENKTFAMKIAEALGYLPLALAHASGYIFVQRCLSTYLDMYRQSRAQLLSTTPQELPQDYRLSVATTIQMSLDHLSPEVREIIRLFSRLQCNSIAHSIILKATERRFRHVCETSEAHISSETAEHAKTLFSLFCPSGSRSEFDFNDLIYQCLQYSLLRITTQGEEKFYTMHVLVQSYLQSSLDSVKGHQIDRLAVRLIGSTITVDADTAYTYLVFNHLLAPHLQCFEVMDVTEPGDHFGYGVVVHEQGNVLLAVKHLECAVEIWGTTLGAEHETTMGALELLAVSYGDAGRYQDATFLEEKLLEMRRRLLGDDHSKTLAVTAGLALSYSQLGRYQDALRLRERVLEMRMRAFGEAHVDTAYAMGNLASSYKDLGRYEDALRLEQKVLEVRKQLLGDEHPSTLITMGNIGNSYSNLHMDAEALQLDEKVLEVTMRVMGEEHPETVIAMGNLASSYGSMGQQDKACELKEKVLELRKGLLGDEHPDTITAMNNLAVTYANMHRDQEALGLHKKVLELRKRVLGDDHPDTAISTSNLAVSYFDLRMYEEALELLEKVLEMRKRSLGDEHPDTLRSMWNLANALDKAGKAEKTEALLCSALPLHEKVFGNEHKYTVAIRDWLGRNFHVSGPSDRVAQVESSQP